MTPRLSPCPCGSGRQYRRCCRATDRAAEDARIKAESDAIRRAADERAILAIPCNDCTDRREMYRRRVRPLRQRRGVSLARLLAMMAAAAK